MQSSWHLRPKSLQQPTSPHSYLSSTLALCRWLSTGSDTALITLPCPREALSNQSTMPPSSPSLTSVCPTATAKLQHFSFNQDLRDHRDQALGAVLGGNKFTSCAALPATRPAPGQVDLYRPLYISRLCNFHDASWKCPAQAMVLLRYHPQGSDKYCWSLVCSHCDWPASTEKSPPLGLPLKPC